jgi:hypothetical protein
MGARLYDARLGRWISADTIIPDPANPQSFNRFSYVLNNPLRYIDPTGHVPEPEDPWWQQLNNFLAGASFQFLDDRSYGLLAEVDDFAFHQTNQLSLQELNVDNQAYQNGRWTGRTASNIVAVVEMAVGVVIVVETLAAAGPIIAACNSGGATIGGVLGGLIGGGGGSSVGPKGTIALGGGGAAVGAIGGGAAGAVAGTTLVIVVVATGAVIAIDGTSVLAHNLSNPVHFSRGRPSSNQYQNRQFHGAVGEVEKQIGRDLSKDEVQQWHREMQRHGDVGYWEIVDIGLDLFDTGGN